MMLAKIILSCLAIMLLGVSVAGAQPIRNKDGSMPMVHWAVLRSEHGKMPEMMAMAGRNVAPVAAQEDGTYALYGGVDSSDTDLMRLLELYRDEAAYEEHVGSDAFHRYEAEREPILKELILLEMTPLVLEAKPSGEARAVKMLRLEIAPEELEQYLAELEKEVVRAVAKEAGVMGMFVTAEIDNPNVLHILELYSDEAAFQEYLNSRSFKRFERKTDSMVTAKKLIDNLPTLIRLTGKPL